MIHSRRHVFFILLACALLTLVFLATGPARPGRDGRGGARGRAPAPAREARPFPRFSEEHATAIAPAVVKPRESGPSAAEVVRSRYRLAGVTLDRMSPDRSSAIVEERESGRQRRLRPGDDLDDSCRLSVVCTNSVLVATPRGMVALFAEKARMALVPPPAFATASSGDMASVMARFGATRVDTNTWNFSRETIMDYYRELLDRPERLVKVFDSLAPVYNDKAEIEGYRVDVRGEKDFFRAIGFKQGDIVRSVNGIDMTNRRRAENLIRRYAADDLDFIVIELDRDGKREKQYYYSK